jgi:coproporphyrinogen III oxidase-like Fe-S oxidoreductase
MKSHGYDRYEISNFALNETHRSQHNQWGWKGLSYIGIGPGACGRLWGKTSFQHEKVKRGFRQFRHPETWMKAVESHGHGTQEDFELSFEQRIQELLLSGLRMKNGISDSLWKFHSDGKSLDQVLKPKFLERMSEKGYLEWASNSSLKVTERGAAILDSLLVDLDITK